MDRRQMSGSVPPLTRPNSFIPTSANQNNGKLGPLQIQQLAFQSQLQAQSHPHISIPPSTLSMNNNLQHHNHHQQPQYSSHSTYYQNLSTNHQAPPPPPNQNRYSHGTLPRHSVMSDLQYNHPSSQPQSLNTRTLTKSYSSHYGNTPMNHHHQNTGGNPLYGNLMGVATGRQLINGHGPSQPQHQQQHLDPVPVIHQTHPPSIQIQPVIHQIQQQHHSNKILQHYPSVDGDGLPPTLVESMRTLFDILDDTKEGRVRLSDIESRWENGDTSGVTKGNTGAEPLIKMGVMGYLRKVTPPDGMLTFDRFCSGLRLALVTNNNQASAQIYGNKHNNPQSLHVKNVPNHNGFYNNNTGPPPNSAISNNTISQIQRPTSMPISTTNQHSNSNQTHQSIQNTIQRTSRIPGLSTTSPSRLPMANGSGIPISPKNKIATNLLQNNQSNSAMGTARRIPLTQSQHAEQGTTVAIVHQPPPPPNPKPINPTGVGVLPLSHPTHDLQIGTIKFTKPSLITPPNGGFTKNSRYSSKNGSLDNLKSDTEETNDVKVTGKVRPPSAPILDTTDDDDGAEYYSNRSSNKRDRARSRDRDIEESKRGGSVGPNNRRGKSPAEELSFGKRVVSFVTPRQRTLSLPQLQLNKLKSKSIPLDDDSSPSASSSSHSPLSSGETKIGALKSSLKASIQGSAIPTKMSKQKSDFSTNDENKEEVRNGNNGTPLSFKDTAESSNSDKEMQPAPPKPPRNTGMIQVPPSGTPPLSGSSTTSTNPSKPEIRQFLQSWKNGVAEKRSEENNAKQQQTIDNNVQGETTTQVQDTENPTTTGTVKLRGDKKANLRRRETARRHTVQSGIDFATLKRLKQLEQERDVLQQGMNSLEKAKEWYHKQMETVDEKITLLTKGVPIPDQWTESLEERLNLLGCRISEVNSLLAVLMDGSSQIPNHMNLQIPSHLSVRTITRLKEQNRQLTQEVSDCSHRVTQLETEKAMLLRQLFHQKTNLLPEETVYM